jgi:hypothetical protein
MAVRAANCILGSGLYYNRSLIQISDCTRIPFNASFRLALFTAPSRSVVHVPTDKMLDELVRKAGGMEQPPAFLVPHSVASQEKPALIDTRPGSSINGTFLPTKSAGRKLTFRDYSRTSTSPASFHTIPR